MAYGWSKAKHDEIETLAYQLWEERGRPLGSPDVDWFRAQEDLRRHLDVPEEIPFSLIMEPVEV